jgi:PST family polysaccharide transporter
MTAGLGNVAARGAGITLTSQGIRFALQLGSLIVLARLLSPQEFGVVAMVTAITNVMEIVRDFGLSSAAMQAKELNDAERTNLFWVNTGIGTGCALLSRLPHRPRKSLKYTTIDWLRVLLVTSGRFVPQPWPCS